MNSKAINIFSFTIIKVQKNEISEQEVNNIRVKASKQMYEYNFDTMLWLWSSVGLYDVSLQYEQNINQIYNSPVKIDKRTNTTILNPM